MSNANPLPGRLAQTLEYQAANKGSLAQALERLERAMSKCDGILDAPVVDPEIVCRAVHALAIGSATVLKLCGALELDSRLRQVEQELDFAHNKRPRLVKNRQ